MSESRNPEPTPVHDEVAKSLKSASSHDETDVPAALERNTDDGPGDLDNLPESDWVSFATEGVEKEDDK